MISSILYICQSLNHLIRSLISFPMTSSLTLVLSMCENYLFSCFHVLVIELKLSINFMCQKYYKHVKMWKNCVFWQMFSNWNMFSVRCDMHQHPRCFLMERYNQKDVIYILNHSNWSKINRFIDKSVTPPKRPFGGNYLP